MKKIVATIILLSMAIMPSLAQSGNGGRKAKESSFHLGLDIQTKYIWRGMEMMSSDSAPVLFPQINYQHDGLFIYAMGATAINGKHSEVDLGISYTYKWLTVGFNDYYYPTVDTPFDSYFNLKGRETGHWLEGIITIAPENIPVYLTVSNFFFGADKDLQGRQAYSTYAEIGGFYDFLDDHRLSIALGTAFNKSCYNGYEHDLSICNIDLKYTYNLKLGEFTLPLSAEYIVNPVYNKTFMNFIASFAF